MMDDDDGSLIVGDESLMIEDVEVSLSTGLSSKITAVFLFLKLSTILFCEGFLSIFLKVSFVDPSLISSKINSLMVLSFLRGGCNFLSETGFNGGLDLKEDESNKH